MAQLKLDLDHAKREIDQAAEINSENVRAYDKLGADYDRLVAELEDRDRAFSNLEEDREELSSKVASLHERLVSAEMHAQEQSELVPELKQKISEMEQEMENPKALTMNRALNIHK